MTLHEEESSPLTLAAGMVTLDFPVSRTEGNPVRRGAPSLEYLLTAARVG